MSLWQPDLLNGFYKNPILNADYSDPDAIRVGDDYWMTASSFCHVPGLPILHSRDLVNWTLVNHALPALVPHDYFSTVRHGQGVWAPAIRHHAGKFWIYYPDPDFGIYVITADDPRGAWSAPVRVKAGKGFIDPCPFWDDDGSVWLVHGWAKSRSGICNLITLQRLSADGTRVEIQSETIIDGDKMPGWNTIEGPKFYKRNGWYYIFAPAGGVATGYQAVFRSRNILGPYENHIVLEQGSTPVNGPHQGAWVDTPAGEHWFLHFQEIPAMGRVVHLEPMRWQNDWPVMGTAAASAGSAEFPLGENAKKNLGAPGIPSGAAAPTVNREQETVNRGGSAAPGHPVLTHPKPAAPAPNASALQPFSPSALSSPATSDDFSAPALGLQWQWQANPRDDWACLDPVAKTLCLPCLPMTAPASHWLTPHLLMQKFPSTDFRAEVTLDFPAAQTRPGDHAGLMVFGYDYVWLGLAAAGSAEFPLGENAKKNLGAPRNANDAAAPTVNREPVSSASDSQPTMNSGVPAAALVLATCHKAQEGNKEQILATLPAPATDKLHLRVEITNGHECHFSHSADGQTYIPIGPVFQATLSKWVGAKVGLFAASAPAVGASLATPSVSSPATATFRNFQIT